MRCRRVERARCLKVGYSTIQGERERACERNYDTEDNQTREHSRTYLVIRKQTCLEDSVGRRDCTCERTETACGAKRTSCCVKRTLLGE